MVDALWWATLYSAGMLSLREVAHIVGADVRRVMAGFVIVLLEGRYSVRRMTAGFMTLASVLCSCAAASFVFKTLVFLMS